MEKIYPQKKIIYLGVMALKKPGSPDCDNGGSTIIFARKVYSRAVKKQERSTSKDSRQVVTDIETKGRRGMDT